ncbi:hypothetical protein BH24DEI2_BH24DEI2_10550 [soil metagenome]
MNSDLEQQFDLAMMNIYKRALAEANYKATRFLQMLTTRSGLEVATTLLRSNAVSEGYTALYERQRLDLTVEALVLQPRWQPLFTVEELAMAQQRLREYQYLGLLAQRPIKYIPRFRVTQKLDSRNPPILRNLLRMPSRTLEPVFLFLKNHSQNCSQWFRYLT